MKMLDKFRQVWTVVFSVICLVSCTAGEPDQRSVPGPPSPVDQDSSPSVRGDGGSGDPAPAQSEKRPAIEPLKAPQAYFGELPLSRLDKPVALNPSENGSVVLIIVDALNAKHMGIYGYHRDTSPNMDRLAKRGVLLSNYVSNSSWTRPSFTTMITGQPKSVHRMEWDGNNLDKQIVTLAERFREAGYRTAAFVGNQVVQKLWGFNQGFQVYEDVKSLNQIHPRDERLVSSAISWLKKSGEKPFFMMLFLIDTHAPYRPLRAHRHFLDALPEGEVIRYPQREYQTALPEGDRERLVAAYDGELHNVDTQIERLVQFLERTDRLKRTSIVVTADHGEAFGQHNCYTHMYHMWESVLRVPFILVSPVIQARGVYDDRPFTHVDIAPTLLDLAGLDYPSDELPGISIVQALKDPAMVRDRVIFSQFNAQGVRRQAIRRGPWKLVHHHKVGEDALKRLAEFKLNTDKYDPRSLPSLALDKERYEFYNLAADPLETRNLFSSDQGRAELKELLDALQPYLAEERPRGKLTPEMIKALENIGYIKR